MHHPPLRYNLIRHSIYGFSHLVIRYDHENGGNLLCQDTPFTALAGRAGRRNGGYTQWQGARSEIDCHRRYAEKKAARWHNNLTGGCRLPLDYGLNGKLARGH